jgi:formamidopyrimidine-DNA glycosylase
MPELPEVETIKQHLRDLVVGSLITDVEVLDPGLVEQPSTEEFERELKGDRISGARRRAKHLIVELDSGNFLVFQLKIGGQLLLVPPVEEPKTALMLVLHLDGDRRLFLRDETRFTRARLLNAEELEARLSTLGPEPLEEEFKRNGVEYLQETLSPRRAQIKPLLLDQKVVSGIGNIYVDEILYDARLHPRRKANTLSGEEWGRLHAAIIESTGGQPCGCTRTCWVGRASTRTTCGSSRSTANPARDAKERWFGRRSGGARRTSVPPASVKTGARGNKG